jgi:molybdate transport system ATP-binding protein
MSLLVSASKRLGKFTLDVNITLPGSGIHAVVGPSGSGKSTLLRLITGLETLDRGFIRFQDSVWSDRQTGIHLAPWQRPVGMVFQDLDLFPHLTLLDNVLFATTEDSWAEYLMRSLDVWVLRSAKPDQVSGGERQRCAICQALARKPRLLLLDEPFSALDVVTRHSLGKVLVETAARMDIPMVLVTHDLEEAFTLAESILTLVEGRVSDDWLERRIAEMERDVVKSRELYRMMRDEKRL